MAYAVMSFIFDKSSLSSPKGDKDEFSVSFTVSTAEDEWAVGEAPQEAIANSKSVIAFTTARITRVVRYSTRSPTYVSHFLGPF